MSKLKPMTWADLQEIEDNKAIPKVTKKDVSNCFSNLKKYGYDVKNFNAGMKSNRYNHGSKGWIDHVIMGKGHIHFIEVKLYKDTLKPEQIETGKHLKYISEMNPFCFYHIATQDNYSEIYTNILQANYKKLKLQK